MDVRFKPLDGFSGSLSYAHAGDGAFDVRAAEDVRIGPHERRTLRCGFSIAVPKGHGGLVIPRSGLAAEHGITVLNAPGLIDSGYRGEVMVVLYNSDRERAFDVRAGDRIAQMAIVALPEVRLAPCDDLGETKRGAGGLGSSGIA